MDTQEPRTAEPLSAAVQEQVAEVLEQYLEDLERGVARDPDELLAAYPEWAGVLREYLEGLHFLRRATAELPARRPSTPDLQEQQLGDYRILRELGRGGMGIVYEARQLSLGRRVALKVLPFAALLDQKQITRFQNEAQAAAQLHHPHIVPVYAVGCERGVHYYSMQYIDGQSLEHAIEGLRQVAGGGLPEAAHPAGAAAGAGRRGPHEPAGEAVAEFVRIRTANPPNGSLTTSATHLPSVPPEDRAEARTAHGFSTARSIKSRDYVQSVARLGIQAAEALHFAHQRGVVHRDVKPSNLLLDGQGALWVADFGLARIQDQASVTVSGDLLGTLRYMSPEQAAGSTHLVDHRTDVYSLGVTLYELLTLRPAFDATDRQRLLHDIAHDSPPPLRRLNLAIPADLETIVSKAMAKSRDERYASAQDLADDLQRYLDGKPTLARRPTAADRAAKWVARHARAVAATACLLGLLLAGTAVATVMMARQQAETQRALQRAERHLREVQRVVDRFGAETSEQLAQLPGAEPIRQRLLRETATYYESFVRYAAADPALQEDLAKSHFKTAAVLEQLGDEPAAIAAYERARDAFRELATRSPDEPRFRADWALSHNNLALVRARRGQVEAARTDYETAIRLQSELAADGRRITPSPRYPGERAGERGEAANADVILRPFLAGEADELRYPHELALSQMNLGLLHSELGETRAAEDLLRQAIEGLKRLSARSPDHVALRRNLAMAYNNLHGLRARADAREAEQLLLAAIAVHRQLAEEDAANDDSWRELALCENNLGKFYCDAGQTERAQPRFQAAVAALTRLVARAPHNVRPRADLATSHNNLGRLAFDLGQGDEAEAAFDTAEQLLTRLCEEVPGNLGYRSRLGGVLNNLGVVYERAGRRDEAAAAYAAAMRHQQFACDHARQVVPYRQSLEQHRANLNRVTSTSESATGGGRQFPAAPSHSPCEPSTL